MSSAGQTEAAISTAGNSIEKTDHISNAITNITDSKVTGGHLACELPTDGPDALLELTPVLFSTATGRKMWEQVPSLGCGFCAGSSRIRM